MSKPCFDIVILGLSITSSWGNGHATTYRGLVQALVTHGHHVLFLERDVPWYASQRDLPHPPYGHTALYSSLEELRERFTPAVQHADVVIVGSYVPEGIAVGSWVTQIASGITAFYDIDTPVTLANVHHGSCGYLSASLIPQYDMYLSFTGGRTLAQLEQVYGAPMARPLYCSVDPSLYYPEARTPSYDLGYMGTYSADRQPPLQELLLEPACAWPQGRFIVVGPQYPPTIRWPSNVARREHFSPEAHRDFYNSQRFTLNVTRAAMRQAGYSPSVRLFEAAACGTPIITDAWEGLETFFTPGQELLISRASHETLQYLRNIGEEERHTLGERARTRVRTAHTAAHRAEALQDYVLEVWQRRRLHTL